MSEGRGGGVGPWVVYMAVDDGAILIEAPEDAVTPSDRELTGARRTQCVIGRGATAEEARADARRQLGRG